MEGSRLTLIALLCVLFSSQKRISGADVEIRVRPGENVTLYSDCVLKSGFYPVWFRNCSHENQPLLQLLGADLMIGAFPRFSAGWNQSKGTYDLLIRNITEKDLGVYYCALYEKQYTDDGKGGLMSFNQYHFGNTSTLLSLYEETSPCVTVSPMTTTPHVPAWCISWQLFVTVSAVCVLLSSLFSSISVYRLCRKTELKVSQEPIRKRETGGEEVCYASIDVQNVRTKKKKKNFDSTTYSEVRFCEK